ncbi:MAG: HAMP domain-containing histidine kinase, partial [Sutterellaceae bacterium]|nr:HAMP domain-containing histidine kinase [Sutterellaceae bacterium]
IGKIHRQAIEIARIVDHVRSYAKSRGAEHVSCDLAAILRRCARTTSLASSSGINVALSVRKEPALIEGDPLELELALHNLLKNALEAASEHPSPFVRALLDEAPGGWKVVIENSGAEVPEAVVREMGHAFLGTTKGQKGLGLGLPIALEIVERHGGRTSFEARPGGGLRADVFLPSSKSVIVSAGRRNPGEKTNSGETHV